MKLTHIVLSLFIVLFVTACGSSNSESGTPSSANENNNTGDNNTTDNTIDVNGSVTVNFTDGASRELTLNSEVEVIEVIVFGPDNAPYREGNISVAYPDKVTSGTDVGVFTNSIVAVENGKALFSYIGPKDLQSLVDAGDTGTVFGFYHSSDIATVKDFTLTYTPEANQVVLESYSLKSSLLDTNITIGLESNKQISFYVQNESGNKVDDADMTSMKVDVLNTALVDIENTSGDSGDTLTFNSLNDVSLNIKTGTISGVVPIKVTAVFTDANSKNSTITEIFNVVVLSGPPTAMSISYASTSWDEEYAKLQEHIVVTVTDKYFNPVNTNPAITAGVVAGYAKDAVTGNNMFHLPDSATTGTLNPTTKIFTTNNGTDFSNVDELNEVLVTFGQGYTYDASGKWDFTTSGAAGINELAIIDDYESTATRSNLGFAVGNNFRQDVCRKGREWVGSVKSEDGTYKLDSRGMAKLTLEYDYYLTGKDVVFWANIVGSTNETAIIGKIGEATELTLRGTGLEAATAGVSPGETLVTHRIYIEQEEPAEWYRNANFGYTIVVSDNVIINAVSDSNGNINDCTQSYGVAYVDVTVTEFKGEAGSIEIVNILVADEFEN